MLIADPSGRRWSVRREWLGLRRPRWRGIEDPSSPGSLDVADDPTGILMVIAIVFFVIFLIVVALPLLVFGVELVIVLGGAAVGLAGRLLLGLPWTLEARSDDGRRVVQRVKGWRDSRDALAALRDNAAAGRLTGADHVAAAVPLTPARRATQGALACVLALLWLGGLGSLLALVLAGGVRHAPESGRWGRRLALLAVVLGVAGLLLTALVVLGLVSKHNRVA